MAARVPCEKFAIKLSPYGSSKMVKIALIPARSGSRRVKHKNIRILGDKPLLAYTIDVVRLSGMFDHIFLITDHEKYQQIGYQFGSDEFPLRPKESATSEAPDIKWVEWADRIILERGLNVKHYSILRPTSPFRTTDTLHRAFKLYDSDTSTDTLRAVQPVSEHPGKMWVEKCGAIVPLLPFRSEMDYWHNSQTNTLPKIFVQNASLEIFNSGNIRKHRSITGQKIIPFKTQGLEGFDINTEDDFGTAQKLVKDWQK